MEAVGNVECGNPFSLFLDDGNLAGALEGMHWTVRIELVVCKLCFLSFFLDCIDDVDVSNEIELDVDGFAVSNCSLVFFGLGFSDDADFSVGIELSPDVFAWPAFDFAAEGCMSCGTVTFGFAVHNFPFAFFFLGCNDDAEASTVDAGAFSRADTDADEG